jgi:hypothetical protein
MTERRQEPLEPLQITIGCRVISVTRFRRASSYDGIHEVGWAIAAVKTGEEGPDSAGQGDG